MIIEMHCHTMEHSKCSHAPAAELVRYAYRSKAQGIVLTDHEYLWADDELARLRDSLDLPEDFVLMAGQEVRTRDLGDVLVYGASESIERGTSLDELRTRWPDAALVWAHPYRSGKRPSKEKLLDPRLDGVEIFSSNHGASESGRALTDWHRLGFTAISGTDAHNKTSAGAYPTRFDRAVRDIDGLAAEIRSGRCRPYFMQSPQEGTSHTEVIALSIGPKYSVKRRDLVVKTYPQEGAWEKGERSHEIMAAMDACLVSDRLRLPRPLGASKEDLLLIEEKLAGKTLFETVVSSRSDHAADALRLAAQWIATVHNCRLRVTPVNEFIEIEPGRLDWYLKDMRDQRHPHCNRAEDLMEHVLTMEQAVCRDREEDLVQGHGDFHPKNIFIGEDEKGMYVGAVDLDSSYVLHPAFDVGTFLAQFMNQFYYEPEVLDKVSEELFLQEYMKQADDRGADFISLVNLCKARCCLSILYYLVKVGLGDSENFWHVLVEAERSLTHARFSESRGE